MLEQSQQRPLLTSSEVLISSRPSAPGKHHMNRRDDPTESDDGETPGRPLLADRMLRQLEEHYTARDRHKGPGV